MSGKTFYNTDGKTKLTGTLALSGTAAAGDVLKGKTFYNTNAKSAVTGTLALSGTAAAADVVKGKTFYNTDAKTKVTGTYVAPTPSFTIVAQQEKTATTGSGISSATATASYTVATAGYYVARTISIIGQNKKVTPTNCTDGVIKYYNAGEKLSISIYATQLYDSIAIRAEILKLA